jgi:hypothetical protein
VKLDAFGVFPTWIEVVYKDEGLFFWEGGCMWYSEEKNEPPTIQLRSHFITKKRLYFLYSKEEILAHEALHAIRASLGSHRFEEHFAYLTSTSQFRRFLGPLFTEPKEARYLLITSLLSFFTCLVSPVLSLLMVGIVFFALFGRLIRNWHLFFSCKRKLSFFTDKPLALMLRLTDEEILFFATHNKEQCRDWIQAQKKQNFRWQSLFFLATHSQFWQASSLTQKF